MTQRQFVSLDTIQMEGAAFVQKVNALLPQFDPNFAFNFDQSGFQREIHRPVTLAVCGTKGIDATIGNLNSTTHSYTVMPLLTFSGRLGPVLFICLQ